GPRTGDFGGPDPRNGGGGGAGHRCPAGSPQGGLAGTEGLLSGREPSGGYPASAGRIADDAGRTAAGTDVGVARRPAGVDPGTGSLRGRPCPGAVAAAATAGVGPQGDGDRRRPELLHDEVPVR